MKKQKQNTSPEDIKTLLKIVEQNAKSDRAKALSLFTSLESMMESPDHHMMFGQQASSYLNAATRSNDQLMKVIQTKHKINTVTKDASLDSLDKEQIEKLLEEHTPGVLDYNFENE